MAEDRFLSDEYIAGLFDGEGTVAIEKIKPTPRYIKPYIFSVRTSITIRERGILEEIQKIFGGTILKNKTINGRAKTYKWKLRGRKSILFLQLLSKHCYLKKKQANLALELIYSKIEQNYQPLTDQQYQFRLDCYERMAELNMRGIDKEWSI